MRKPRKGHRFLLILLLLILIGLAIVYDSNTRLVTDEFTLGNASLPAVFEGFRVVQLSDLHTAVFGEGNRDLLDAVREARPDIIAITGDLLDDDTAEDYVRDLMAGLTAIAPVYYVTGNHEWASGWTKELFALLAECGVTALRNEYVVLDRGGEEIIRAGVDDPNGPYDQKTPEALVAEIRADHPSDYILMLAHRDDELAMWARLDVDAVLCGHAHGGLVRLPFTDGLVAPGQGLFPTYTAGIYTEGHTQMLVSRGIGGTHGVPRIFNNPQVVVAVLSRP